MSSQTGKRIESIDLLKGLAFDVYYPIIPWFAVMSLGYCFGPLYDRSFNVKRRRLIFNSIGISFIVLFVVVRGINNYGNLQPWVQVESFSQTAMSFMNPAKYPPSLTYDYKINHKENWWLSYL